MVIDDDNTFSMPISGIGAHFVEFARPFNSKWHKVIIDQRIDLLNPPHNLALTAALT